MAFNWNRFKFELGIEMDGHVCLSIGDAAATVDHRLTLDNCGWDDDLLWFTDKDNGFHEFPWTKVNYVSGVFHVRTDM